MTVFISIAIIFIIIDLYTRINSIGKSLKEITAIIDKNTHDHEARIGELEDVALDRY